MKDTKFRTKLALANLERQVEDAYNEIFEKMFPGIKISYPFKCDGYFESGNIKALVEYKYDNNYADRMEQVKTVLQQLFYLKKFDAAGKPFPNVLVVADRNECFVFHPNVLLKYLDFPGVDWNVAPSSAGWSCPDLLLALNTDKDFNPFIFRIDEWFDLDDLQAKIVDLSKNVNRLVHISEHNIDKIFKTFTDRVFTDRKKISPNDLVGIFLGCICDKGNYYLHPSKKNTLVTSFGNFRVNALKYEAFFKHFSDEVSPREKLRLTEICDRLIEDTNRRRKGEFYTPTPFVDYAHGMISKWLGETWKDEYVVWDCCCGTKNLTRDYRFKELYCSTLEQSELEISKQYNPEATCFQFDFLNDEIQKVPGRLLGALKKGKVLFFLNPPYGTAADLTLGEKTGIANTKTKVEMHNDGVGCGAENLQHQFMYIIAKLSEINPNIKVALFSNPIYLTGNKQKKFLEYFLDKFHMVDGVMFQASHFGDDVSGAWGITFNLWDTGKSEERENFHHKLIDTDENGDVVEVGEKTLYNCNYLVKASDWVKPQGKHPYVESPNVSSALNIVDKNIKWIEGSVGFFISDSNRVQGNAQGVSLFTICAIKGHNTGISILPSNFDRCIQLFSARKLIESNWINQKDEYLASDTTNPAYEEFVNDSIVYSLFHSSSNQSSLRQIDYKDKKWDIKNEFFWMGKDEIMDLADENNLDETYSDARTSEDRFVFKKLQGLTLSPEAQEVLDKANDLVRKSFKYRSLFNDSHPEYQILNWDCGWYQIKALLKEFLPEDLKEFKALYNKLADKMRPRVYSLGFLKK